MLKDKLGTLCAGFVVPLVLLLTILYVWERANPPSSAAVLWSVPMLGYVYLVRRLRLRVLGAVIGAIVYFSVMAPVATFLGLMLLGRDGP